MSRNFSKLELLGWLWRSRWASRYNSEKDSRIYDFVARHYFGRDKLAQQIALEFLKYIDLKRFSATICDRAAGTGIITKGLVEAGFKVRSSDLNLSQLEELSKKIKDVTVVEEDLNDNVVGVDDSTVDGVVAVAADRFMTVKGQRIFVKEAKRVLKTNGILIWPTFFGEYVVGKFKYGRQWRGSPKEKIKLLEENGFKILSNKLKVNGFLEPAVCKLLVAKK